jgi:hypothetical protein
MSTPGKPTEIEQVACEICLKEVPKSEATIAEASDYVLHFCGLECYAKWQSEGGKPKPQGERAGSK